MTGQDDRVALEGGRPVRERMPSFGRNEVDDTDTPAVDVNAAMEKVI